MRKIEEKDLVGKTIESIDTECLNVLKLTFTDGTKLELWAENEINTQYGSIPGIFAEDA